MQHADPETLALIALGEPASDAERSHLEACAHCAAEVASLTATVGVARSVRPTDAPVAPSPAVWDRIRAELALDQAHEGPAGRGDAPAGPGPGDTERPADGRALATVVPLRRRLLPWIATAAAGGVVLGGAGGAWWAGRDSGDDPADVVAEAALDPLPGWEATGDARVVVGADGTRTLVVTLDGTGADGGYHEVWLIDRDVTRLVSLGVLAGTEGRFAVPPDLDLAEFPVVDVSDEPYDGDPSHSGDSIIRGVLDA